MPHSIAASSQPRCTCGRVGLCSASTTPTLRWPSATRCRTAIAAPSAWSVTTDSSTAWCGPTVAVRSSSTTGIPVEASHSRVRAAVGRVHARRDDEPVDAGPVDEPGQLRPVVVGVVGRAAQHDPHVELAGGLLGAADHVGPVVVQRRHEHARATGRASGPRRRAGRVLGRRRLVGRDERHAAVHPPDQALRGELGDVPADRHRGGAERARSGRRCAARRRAAAPRATAPAGRPAAVPGCPKPSLRLLHGPHERADRARAR